MSIQVNDFRWEPGKNDREYIKLLEESRDDWERIAQKAISKLKQQAKAQEPRVLSWDEVYANNRPFVVWHESRYGDEAEPVAFVDGEYVNSEYTLYIEMNFANQRDYMADRDDGFRFWTAEPTFEQMEATPWYKS